MQYANGDTYQGKWKNDRRTGKGRYVWASGEEFLGEFFDDNMITGVFVNRDGTYIDIK